MSAINYLHLPQELRVSQCPSVQHKFYHLKTLDFLLPEIPPEVPFDVHIECWGPKPPLMINT